MGHLAHLAIGAALVGCGDPTHDCTVAVDPALPDAGTLATAVVERDLDPARDVWALSDVHGGYDRAVALLAANHLIDDTMQWTGGDAMLVVLGDLIDKGPQPLEVIALFRALEASGDVIVTLGNHEAEFFADAHNAKATGSDGIDRELCADMLDPSGEATGVLGDGAWLRGRPLAARVNTWFYAHAGNTAGRDVPTLDGALRAAIVAHPDYDDPELVGADSILESRDWYTDASVATANAAALGVGHFVFGHTPSALGAAGAIATAQDGRLFRIDCGMSPDVDDSHGCLLRVHHVDATTEVAEAFDATGASVELWRGPAIR